jgi:hypothetical protein
MAHASLTPEQRVLRAKIAAHTGWAKTKDRTARTQPGRDAFRARFEEQVDPEGVMSEAARRKAVESAMRAHFTKLAFESSKARRRRAVL